MRPVVFDSSFLVAAVDIDIFADSAVDRAKLTALLDELGRTKTRIIIPTPVLAEVFVKRPERMAHLIQVLQRSAQMTIAAFDTAAAAVAAQLLARHWPTKKQRQADWSRHRLKFDIQILAIARVANASVIYTNDHQLAVLAQTEAMKSVNFGDLPSPALQQQALPLPFPETRAMDDPSGSSS